MERIVLGLNLEKAGLGQVETGRRGKQQPKQSQSGPHNVHMGQEQMWWHQ